jgi:DNA-binding CsgD family transcriptional regulator
MEHALADIYLIALSHWRDWLPLLPIVGLVVVGTGGQGTIWIYVDLIFATTILWLICNPFRLLDMFSGKFRICCATAEILLLIAVQAPIEVLSRISLILIASGILLVASSRAAGWRAAELVRQSADVDKVIAHLAHGGDYAASDAWSEHGCAEVRALLHQTANVEVSEAQLNDTYRAVYHLAYLHGSAKLGKALDKAAALRAENKKMQLEITNLQATQREADEVQRQLNEAITENNHLREHWHNAADEAKLLRQQLQSLRDSTTSMQALTAHTPTPDRGAELVRMKDEGLSYGEIASIMDMTTGAVKQAIRRARARLADK